MPKSPQVDSLLESIPRMFANSQNADCCTGAAIDAAIQALAVRPTLHISTLVAHALCCSAANHSPLDDSSRAAAAAAFALLVHLCIRNVGHL